jgi:two-component system chemotaxis response regulator CheY
MLDISELRFLIVDDFSTMRRIIRGLLNEMGVQLFAEAEDGQEALKVLESGRAHHSPVHFVVSDINMPNMNGVELLRRIKAEDSKFRDLPVLMVTAEARKEDIVVVARAGASGYIVKPFTKATLEEKVMRILQKMEGVQDL